MRQLYTTNDDIFQLEVFRPENSVEDINPTDHAASNRFLLIGCFIGSDKRFRREHVHVFFGGAEASLQYVPSDEKLWDDHFGNRPERKTGVVAYVTFPDEVTQDGAQNLAQSGTHASKKRSARPIRDTFRIVLQLGGECAQEVVVREFQKVTYQEILDMDVVHPDTEEQGRSRWFRFGR